MSILNSIYGEAKGAGSSLDQMNTSLEKLLDADTVSYTHLTLPTKRIV